MTVGKAQSTTEKQKKKKKKRKEKNRKKGAKLERAEERTVHGHEPFRGEDWAIEGEIDLSVMFIY